jgi:phenylpropionate dioxygenase-like ring-hydroxylating dioxygenase large terminal subunit
MNDTRNFDRADFGLAGFRTDVRAGFAFVCFDDDAPDLDAQLGDFEAVHADWPLADLVSTRRRSLQVECNWKAFLDVFNEYYHLPYVHPDSLNDIYNPPDPADTVTGAYATQFGSTEGTGGLLEDQQAHALPPMPGLKGRAATGARYTWVFPNLTFAAGQDAVWIYQAFPLGPERCQVYQTICFPPETVAAPRFEARAAAYYHRLDAALDEDLPARENQQKGMASHFAAPGRFSVLMEPNVAAFAAWYGKTMLASEYRAS